MTDTPAADRLFVLAGGLSYERDVSLRSGRRAAEALRAAGADVELHDSDEALLTTLREAPPAAVVIALHGASGEDGSLRAVLDLMGVPYVGAGAEAARVTWDKPSAKTLLRRAGIPTPDAVALPQDRFSELGAAEVLGALTSGVGLPLTVKPAQGGSGLGVSTVTEAGDLPSALVAAFGYHSTALVERHVPGVDVAVSVLDLGDGPRALPPVEIATESGAYDFAARYTAGMTTWHVPARLAAPCLTEARRLAVAAHRALEVRDLSRVDMIVAADGSVWVLDVNVAPGLTETSLLPMAVAAEGMELGSVLRQLAELAATRTLPR